ncbi:hypothetical protein [Pseudonocardia sp. NPDC049635]|uniref:hypothetical protein n=1 Tax=Pseudonocardia sp. NPDC049635 TaxID=3155506 RepID=UPI0033CF04AD
MVLTILAVLPVLAVLLVMALQPLLELWDDRASERDDAAVPTGRVRWAPEIPGPTVPAVFPEALGDVSAVLSVPHPRRPARSLHPVR